MKFNPELPAPHKIRKRIPIQIDNVRFVCARPDRIGHRPKLSRRITSPAPKVILIRHHVIHHHIVFPIRIKVRDQQRPVVPPVRIGKQDPRRKGPVPIQRKHRETVKHLREHRLRFSIPTQVRHRAHKRVVHASNIRRNPIIHIHKFAARCLPNHDQLINPITINIRRKHIQRHILPLKLRSAIARQPIRFIPPRRNPQ